MTHRSTLLLSLVGLLACARTPIDTAGGPAPDRDGGERRDAGPRRDAGDPPPSGDCRVTHLRTVLSWPDPVRYPTLARRGGDAMLVFSGEATRTGSTLFAMTIAPSGDLLTMPEPLVEGTAPSVTDSGGGGYLLAFLDPAGRVGLAELGPRGGLVARPMIATDRGVPRPAVLDFDGARLLAYEAAGSGATVAIFDGRVTDLDGARPVAARADGGGAHIARVTGDVARVDTFDASGERLRGWRVADDGWRAYVAAPTLGPGNTVAVLQQEASTGRARVGLQVGDARTSFRRNDSTPVELAATFDPARGVLWSISSFTVDGAGGDVHVHGYDGGGIRFTEALAENLPFRGQPPHVAILPTGARDPGVLMIWTDNRGTGGSVEGALVSCD